MLQMGMMKVMELVIINQLIQGSGTGVTIKEIAETIAGLMPDNCEIHLGY